MKSKGTWFTVLGVVAGIAGSYWLAREYERARASCSPFLKRMYARSDDLVADLSAVWNNPRGLRSLRENPRIDA